MGAPESGIAAGEQPGTEALLTAFRTIKDSERARHEQVLEYWLSIRGDKEFPPLHDLDPLEISDAAENSLLFELLSGGQDAEVRHVGAGLTDDVTVSRLIDAPSPSLLSSIARKLPIVGISRDFLAFEDSFTNADGLTRCWITLLPLSSCGSWVDYVYAFVSIDKAAANTGKSVAAEPEAPLAEEPVAEEGAAAEDVAAEPEAIEEPVAQAEEAVPEPEPEPEVAEAVETEPEVTEATEAELVTDEPVEEVAEPQAIELPVEATIEPEAQAEPEAEAEAEPEVAPEPDPEPEALPEVAADEPAKGGPGFSKILEGLATLTGFYGQGVTVTDPQVEVDLSEAEPLPGELPDAEPLELEETASLPEREEAPEETLDAAETPLELDAPAPALEGALQNKLTEVRAKADEARAAALRATAALHEGLSAAYDFALDAETSPEEYLRLVEAQGLKIQLRAPMAPVGKLAFDGLVDAATLVHMEKILAWALKVELRRGGLLERIDRAGGIPELLREIARAS